MAAVAIVQGSGICPLTKGIPLWPASGSWATPGGPGYVDVDPNA